MGVGSISGFLSSQVENSFQLAFVEADFHLGGQKTRPDLGPGGLGFGLPGLYC